MLICASILAHNYLCSVDEDNRDHRFTTNFEFYRFQSVAAQRMQLNAVKIMKVSYHAFYESNSYSGLYSNNSPYSFSSLYSNNSPFSFNSHQAPVESNNRYDSFEFTQ